MLPNQDEAMRDRRRRLLALMCSLMSMVLVLSLLSSSDTQASTRNSAGDPPSTVQVNPFHGPEPSPQPESSLARVISALPMGDFPANITGTFNGKWDSSIVRLNRTFGGDHITYVHFDHFQDLSWLWLTHTPKLFTGQAFVPCLFCLEII